MIKRLIRDLLPYCLVRSIQRKKYGKSFFNLDNNQEIQQDVKSCFSTILSIQGFGCSGHTALINLFQEYDNIQECTKNTSDGESSYEIDFMRLGGGVLDFEKYLDSSNIFQNDAAYHRLLKQMASCLVFSENTSCKALANRYLSMLLDMKLSNLSTVYYNGALADKDSPDTSIYYIKNMPVKDFRHITRSFLTAVFNEFSCSGKDILMLDHFFTDYEWDMNTYKDYVPGIKVIALYRDPRDVYYYARQKNVEWIPHANVMGFINWCKKTYGKFDIHSSDFFPLRFEDLIMDYDFTVQKIEEYVGIDPKNHLYKKRFLNPEVSMNNISIWKNSPELAEDMETIKQSLGELCYN